MTLALNMMLPSLSAYLWTPQPRSLAIKVMRVLKFMLNLRTMSFTLESGHLL